MNALVVVILNLKGGEINMLKIDEEYIEEARKKVVKVRANLILEQPFFGSLALKLRVVPDIACQTLWVDGVRMGFSPEFVTNLRFEELKGAVCHEVMHCACAHMSRRGDRNPKKWNVAADYAINSILVDGNFVLPQGCLVHPGFNGKSAEEIYGLLPDGDGGGSGAGDGVPDWNSDDPGGCGEVRDYPGDDGQQGNGNGKGTGPPPLVGPASKSQKAQAETDWKIAAAQAAQAGRAMGNMPAGLERFVKELVDPKVCWKEQLRQFVERSSKNDYTWRRPNRRYIPMGVYLPSLWSEELGHVVIGDDTSGSVSQSEQDQFSAEVSSILEEYKTEITVIYCDTKIAGIEEFTQEDLPLRLKAKGGGGTDFRPPFEYVKEQGIEPVCFIYLTDLECNRYPDPPPDYPVLWVSTKDPEDCSWAEKPPFGEVIVM